MTMTTPVTTTLSSSSHPHGLHHCDHLRYCPAHHNNYPHQHEISCAGHLQFLCLGVSCSENKRIAKQTSQGLWTTWQARGRQARGWQARGCRPMARRHAFWLLSAEGAHQKVVFPFAQHSYGKLHGPPLSPIFTVPQTLHSSSPS